MHKKTKTFLISPTRRVKRKKHEYAIALYDGDEAQLREDIEEEMQYSGSTDCYWTTWWGEK